MKTIPYIFLTLLITTLSGCAGMSRGLSTFGDSMNEASRNAQQSNNIQCTTYHYGHTSQTRCY